MVMLGLENIYLYFNVVFWIARVYYEIVLLLFPIKLRHLLCLVAFTVELCLLIFVIKTPCPWDAFLGRGDTPGPDIWDTWRVGVLQSAIKHYIRQRPEIHLKVLEQISRVNEDNSEVQRVSAPAD
jgi:hypothetical protein